MESSGGTISFTMQLYIIRHAQSTNNALGDPRDRDRDPMLTEIGERQADILAHHLGNGIELVPPSSTTHAGQGQAYQFTHLYCSPMWRSLQTAAPLGRALGLTPEVWVDIHEQGGIYLDHGDGRGLVGYSGTTRQEIQARFPQFVLPEDITEQGWWNKGYEDWPACHQRAVRVAEKLRQRARCAPNGHERVAIVSHGGFIDALLKALFNQSEDRAVFYYHYNTAISRIDFHQDGYLAVRYLNRVDHLPPGLVT
ncbi:MAG: histidine phosphatase family protein [Anaerolineae bacterium]